MKFLSILFLLSFGYFVTQSPIENAEDFTFELTVNSQDADPAKFDLVITGFSLSENGDEIPYILEEQDLETPYKLILKDGKYTAEIRNRSPEKKILSKVQGIYNGSKRGGSGSSDSNQPTLQFGIGGTMSVKDN